MGLTHWLSLDFGVNTNTRFIAEAPNHRTAVNGSIALEHGGSAAGDLDLDENTVKSIRKASLRRKTAKGVVAIVSPIVSYAGGYALGSLRTPPDVWGSYPLAVALVGTAAAPGRKTLDPADSAPVRRLSTLTLGVIAISALTFLFGFLLGFSSVADDVSVPRYGVAGTSGDGRTKSKKCVSVELAGAESHEHRK